MGATLHILIPEAAPQATPQDGARVLNSQLTRALKALNEAKRGLRALGLMIEGEQLPLTLPESRAEILLAPKQNVAGLLQKSRGMWWKREGNRRVAHTVFMGVTVSWEDA